MDNNINYTNEVEAAIKACEERFWEKVDKEGGDWKQGMPTKCWNWLGSPLQDGYGQFSIPAKDKRILKMPHNCAWVLNGGHLPPKGYKLHHLCENPRCVNPNHQAMVTIKGHAGLHAVKFEVRCKHDHILDENNVYIRPSGKVECKTCADISRKRYNEKARA